MAQQLTYNAAQHREYLTMIDQVGRNWLEVFQGNTDFYSAVYWDLLTGIWRRDGPVRKTDALGFMTSVKSPQTAGRYVEDAIRQGILQEKDNPRDARSKLLSLTPEMKDRLDAFFDKAVGEVRSTVQVARRQGTVAGDLLRSLGSVKCPDSEVRCTRFSGLAP